ncbi:hypothetical protein KAW18_02255 [candidate division WOR-3 bacterium]|nr:hypothetical protein [candidate division WOR-3 bacterium]
MMNYECFKIFIVMAFIAVVGILGVEYLNQRIIRSMKTVIDSLRDHIKIQDKIIEVLREKLIEKEK